MSQNSFKLTPNLELSDLCSYEAVLAYLKESNRNKHLLIGNGHSMAYDHAIFSYNALYDFIEEIKDPILSKLFSVINTRNFEQIMRELDQFIQLAKIFDKKKDMVEELKQAHKLLQSSLIDAITQLHPEHIFQISDEAAEYGYKFFEEYINNGGKVFSTNYDLLLYWILMRNKTKRYCDGFGKELLNPEEVKKGEEAVYDDLEWGENKNRQNIFYLHGTLPIFDTGIAIEKEIYKNQIYLLTNIKNRMSKKEYPIFVTAGNGKEKLKQIYRNRYLNFCYEHFSNIEGSLISFGFNFGEYDTHIIEAINVAAKQGKRAGNKLYSIYIGVYSDNDLEHIKRIENKFKCKVNVYNARTANVWGTRN